MGSLFTRLFYPHLFYKKQPIDILLDQYEDAIIKYKQEEEKKKYINNSKHNKT